MDGDDDDDYLFECTAAVCDDDNNSHRNTSFVAPYIYILNFVRRNVLNIFFLHTQHKYTHFTNILKAEREKNKTTPSRHNKPVWRKLHLFSFLNFITHICICACMHICCFFYILHIICSLIIFFVHICDEMMMLRARLFNQKALIARVHQSGGQVDEIQCYDQGAAEPIGRVYIWSNTYTSTTKTFTFKFISNAVDERTRKKTSYFVVRKAASH